MIARVLSEQEKQHLHTVIDQTFKLFEADNKYKTPLAWIDAALVRSIEEFKGILSDNNLAIKIRREEQGEVVSKGSFEVQGIEYPVRDTFLHQLKVSRVGDVVECAQRDLDPNKQKKDKEVDMSEYGSRFKTHAMKSMVMKSSKLDNMVSRYQSFKDTIMSKSYYNRFKDNLSSYTIVVEEIPLKIHYQLTQQGSTKEENTLELRTKWLHEIESRTADSVKRMPKRILFDVEDWHRGFFVPVYKFNSDE